MKCPRCGYENAAGVQVCNSCARLLPQVEAALPGATGRLPGPLPSKFILRSARGFSLVRRLAVSNEAGQTLFSVAPRGSFRHKIFEFLPQHGSVSAAGFSVRLLPMRFPATSSAYQIEDSGGGLIGLIRVSPLSLASSLVLETPSGLVVSARRTPPRLLLSLLLRFIPYVGHLAAFVDIFGAMRPVHLDAGGQHVVTYRRSFTGIIAEVHAIPSDLDPRLLLAGAFFAASTGTW